MKKVIWLAILLLITGCANMTPQERQVAYIIGGVIVVGVIISANDGHDSSTSCRLVPVPGGAHIQVCE